MKTAPLWIALLIIASAGLRTRARAADEPPPVFELRDDKLEITDRALTLDPTRTRATLDVVLEPPITAARRPADGAPPPRELATVDAQLARAWFGAEPLAADAFSVTLAHGASWTLHVGFAVTSVARPGIYKLAVNFVDRSTRERLQRVVLVLERPPAKLRAVPEAIAIDVVQWWPHELARLDEAVQIKLEETANKTGAIATTTDTGAARNDGRAIAAGLRLGGGAIAAGSRITLPVGIEGAFPPGRSAGELEVRSEQAEPFAIKYEVRTHLAGAVIALALFGGWLIGLLVRVVLVRAGQRFDLIQQIAAIREEATALGQAFTGAARTQIDAVIAACRTAEQRWSGLEAARADLRSRLDTLKTQLQGQLATARAEVQAFANAITPGWKLAAPIQDAMASLQNALARARAALTAGDPARVQLPIDEAFEHSVPRLVAQVDAWQKAGHATASQLETALSLRPWPEPVRQPTQEAAVRWRELLAAIPTERPGDPDALLGYLRAVHGVRVHVDAAAIALAASWKMIVDACAAITAACTPNPLAAMPGRLPVLDDGEGYLAALAGQTAGIVDSLHAGLLALVPAGHPRRKEVETWLDDGKWIAAVTLAREVATPGLPGAMLGGAAEEPAEPGFVHAGHAVALDLAAATVVHATPAAVATRARRFQLATLWATWLLSGLLLVAFYTVYFATRQPATFLELLGVAGQAFSVDVGVAAIATIAANLGK